MIRIRYKDFAAGTHDGTGLYGRVERCHRGVTVYLLPGLAGWQRRAVIRRLRQEASRGFGPALPLPQLAIALGLDRVRTAARIARASVRLHPAVTLVPGACVVAMMTLFVIASGDRAGIAPGMRGGLAAAVSGSVARAVASGPAGARMTQVTVAEGTSATAVGGTGLGSRAWYVCPHALSAPVPQRRNGQLACRRPASRAVPHTAHLPGPLDFAW